MRLRPDTKDELEFFDSEELEQRSTGVSTRFHLGTGIENLAGSSVSQFAIQAFACTSPTTGVLDNLIHSGLGRHHRLLYWPRNSRPPYNPVRVPVLAVPADADHRTNTNYIVQHLNYEIVEGFGCGSVISSNTIVTYLLDFSWPVIISCVSLVYYRMYSTPLAPDALLSSNALTIRGMLTLKKLHTRYQSSSAHCPPLSLPPSAPRSAQASTCVPWSSSSTRRSSSSLSPRTSWRQIGTGLAESPRTWICPASARVQLLRRWPYSCVWKYIHAGSTFIRSSTSSRSSTSRAPRAYLCIARQLGPPIAVTTIVFPPLLLCFGHACALAPQF